MKETKKLSTNKVIDEIMAADTPEEVFGIEITTVKHKHRVYRGLVHPDGYATETLLIQSAVNEAFQKLQSLWEEAKKRINEGIYGTEEPTEKSIITIKGTEFTITGSYPDGDISDVYKCEGGIVLKKARNRRDNDLLENESIMLKYLEKHNHPNYSRYLPILIADYKLKKSKLKVITMPDYGDEFISLIALKKEYPELDPRHIVWIFNRLLTILGFVHGLGVTHAAVLPEHVLIRKRDHALMLLDWSYAVKGSTKVKAISSGRKSFYPNEILNKQPVGGFTDIFMAANTMRWLCDFSKTPKEIVRFFDSCLILNTAYRPQDAWGLLDEFRSVIYSIYGNSKFIELT